MRWPGNSRHFYLNFWAIIIIFNLLVLFLRIPLPRQVILIIAAVVFKWISQLLQFLLLLFANYLISGILIDSIKRLCWLFKIAAQAEKIT